MIAVDRQLEIISQQIVRARIFYDLWWFYKGAATRPKIIDTLNNFSEFFGFDEHGHFVSMVVHCGVTWDKRNIHLAAVAKGILDTKRDQADKLLMDEIDALATKAIGIRTIRNAAIAHRSAAYDYGEAFRRAGLAPARLRDMLQQALGVINELRIRKTMPEAEFFELPLLGLQELVYRLGGPDLRDNSMSDLLGA